MSIEFHCENCQQLIRVPDESVGHQARCPFCQNVQAVPTATDSESAYGATPFGSEAPNSPGAPSPSPPSPSPQPPSPQPPSPPQWDPAHAASEWSTPAPDNTGTSSSPQGTNADTPPISSNPYRDPPANPYVSTSQYPATGNAFAEQWNLASLGDRFLGSVIDYLFLIVAMAPGLAIGSMASKSGSQTLEQVAGVLTFLGLLAFGITQCVLISKRAQSVGKIVMKTRIVTASGAAPGFVHGVLIRNWVFGLIAYVPMVACFCFFPVSPVILLVDALLIFGERRQCLHDMLASTFVVSDKMN